ncbi:hypothetical protein BDP81DRAFT_517425 [Colletotrichum phormii]|uniref:Uncharacterized protein n=1 Tax=Colletotrichum phormii TaxID=359342 RepID=A0AAI9ZTU7_9PEZI|nr:uncharacterized protein BDP81DRAFT_517425 [Colletotrichum phormii]KAK1637746.1 hypothetical protein BDP81DRAFT_517425 [Colletotrichum phormii]
MLTSLDSLNHCIPSCYRSRLVVPRKVIGAISPVALLPDAEANQLVMVVADEVVLHISLARKSSQVYFHWMKPLITHQFNFSLHTLMFRSMDRHRPALAAIHGGSFRILEPTILTSAPEPPILARYQLPAGEIPCLTIRITATCRKDQWITIAASHTDTHAGFPAPRYIHVNHMDNPVFEELRAAVKINKVFVEFRGPWFPVDAPWYSPNHVPRHTSGFLFMVIGYQSRGVEPVVDDKNFWQQWHAPFLCHWAKANDVARFLGSLTTIGTLDTQFKDWDKIYALARQRILTMYWDAFPFGGQWNRVGVPELLLAPFNRREIIPSLVDEDQVLTRFGNLNLGKPQEDGLLRCYWRIEGPPRHPLLRPDRFSPLFFYHNTPSSLTEEEPLIVDVRI